MADICEGIIMEAGPIKHWWDANWDTPEHWAYDAWREAVSAGLVDASFLVYRPHHAFKGTWTERAQAVNDAALRVSDAVVNLTPDGVPSLGTDGEVLYAANFGGIIVPAPPVADHEQGVAELIAKLKALDIASEVVPQEIVTDSLMIEGSQLTKMTSFLDGTEGSMLRVHFYDDKGRAEAIDAKAFSIRALVETAAGRAAELDPRKLIKIEALGRLATGAA